VLYLGLDIGGTKSAALVGDCAGNIFDRTGFASQADRGAGAMIDDIVLHSQSLLGAHAGVQAIGVSIGGPLNSETGVILSPPNLPGWDNIPLKQILEERLKLPVRVEHDAAACCLAEVFWGAGRGCSRGVYLTCGTGFGVGMVFDGKIYHGVNGLSPEIGHTRLRDDGPEAFGKIGSVEAFCAGASLGKLARWKFPGRWATAPAAETIGDLWRGRDSEATEIIELNGRSVGQVCANLADLLRPEAILLGSLAIHLGDRWVEIVRRKFREEALDAASCRVEPAGLGARLQDCSAVAVGVS
jgi:glucokinase